MDIKTAKAISSMSIGILMARQGIGEFSDSDIAKLKETSLAEMLEANRIITDYKEQLPNGVRSFIHTTDKELAALFCRLHDDNFHTTADLEDACTALNDLRDTINGHGILIDGYGSFSFIELNHEGDGAIETLAQSMSPNGLFGQIKQLCKEQE